MEPLTQKIFTSALVTVIKGVAIAGLFAEVIAFYASKGTSRIAMMMRNKIDSMKSQLQLTKS